MQQQIAAAGSAAPVSHRDQQRARAIRRFKWVILTPLIVVLTGLLMPLLMAQLYFSFHQWTVYLGSWNEADFVGLDVFRDVFTDQRFGYAIIRSLVFSTGSTVGCFIIGFGLAYLMYEPFRGQPAYYILFILPMLTVPIVIAYCAEMLLYESGPINDMISRITGTTYKVRWLTDPSMALLTVTLLDIWNWVPFSFIIMLAGLSAVPKEQIEAAKILGAGNWRIFREVQLPALRPVIMLALILRFLEAMGEFPKTWALFQGGPGSATETIPVYIFLVTWQYFEISKGAALSYIVMMIMILIVLGAIRLLRREKQVLETVYAKAGPGDGAHS